MKSAVMLALLAGGPLAGCFADAGYTLTVDDGVDPGGVVYEEDLPPAFVATAEPYYYQGRPTYWYGNAWHYREGGRWNRYRVEPAPLRAFAAQRAGRPAPRMYERPSRGMRR